MRKFVILTLLFFSVYVNAKEVVFKITNFSLEGLNFKKEQILKIDLKGKEDKYNWGLLKTNTDSIEFVIKKSENPQLFIFLKLNGNYELFKFLFDTKSGRYVVSNNLHSIELQLLIFVGVNTTVDSKSCDKPEENNKLINLEIENDINLDYVKSIFGITKSISFFKIDPILTSNTEQSVFDNLELDEDNFIVINSIDLTVDFYFYKQLFKKSLKCNYVREEGSMDNNNYVIMVDCYYKTIKEKFGVKLSNKNGVIETNKNITTNVYEIGTLYNYTSKKHISDNLFLMKLLSDTISPEINIIEPKNVRDLFVKSKSRNVILKGYINDSSNISFLSINGVNVPLKYNYFNKTIIINGNKSMVYIECIDELGNITKKQFEVEVPKENVVEEIDVKETTSIDNVGNYFALIIGINDYKDKRILQLSNPIKDGKSLKNLLIQKYTFETNNIIVLENPDRKSIFKAFLDMKSMLGKNDNLLLFYAGHGFFDKEMDSGYWLPSDSEKDNKSEWISFDDVLNHIRAITSKHTLVISDACFSGGFLKERSITINEKAMFDLYQIPSRKVITSGNLSTVPDESVFMKYLVKSLSENNEKYMTEETLFDKIKIPVVNNSDTTPLIGVLSKTGDEGGNFIFIKR